jgi:hypothetical protein
VAITVGGTPTSSYGGTASQLQIFSLDGNTSQSPAPAIRPAGPGPGVLRAPSQFLAAGAQPHTVTLQLVSSQDDAGCRPTLDGTTRGGMAVKVPKGWKVYVTFANHGARCSDAVAAVPSPGSTTPVFEGAASPGGGVAGGAVAYFSFTASREGKYVIASTVHRRAAAGEWVRFVVAPSDQPPELTLPIGTFAVVGKPGLGG